MTQKIKQLNVRKIISTVLLLLYTSFYSQEYKFDNKFTIKLSHLKPSKKSNGNITVFKNSKNPNYYMMIFFDGKALLWDRENKMLSDYEYKEFEGKSIFKFIFKRSYLKWKDEIKISNISLENSQEGLYVAKCFWKNRKKPNLEIAFTLKPSESDLMEIYFMDLTQNIHEKILSVLRNKLGKNSNFYIHNYTLDYKNGEIIFGEVEKIEKVDLLINSN